MIGSSTASYVLGSDSELSSEYVRHHHCPMNAIFVMNSILSKTFICESRTSLPCKVSKPVQLQLELVLCLLPCMTLQMIAWKTAHASLTTRYKIPPLVHHWHCRYGSLAPYFSNILLRKNVNKLLRLYVYFKGILSRPHDCIRNYPKTCVTSRKI